MAEGDDLSTRYAFLLQPIRDLQRNWDIDISHLLEEFVERMRELSDQSGPRDETVEEGKFNFAEAAILIQGSSMVYGKKVEYVHELARDFYEQLRDKKLSRRRNSDNMEHVDDIDEYTEEPDDPCELMQFTNLPTVDWKTLMLKNEAKPLPLLPQIPISLMPLADFEKTNVPLYSSRNTKEMIGKKDDFFINTGFIHESGALLLDQADVKLLNDFVIEEQSRGDPTYTDVLMQQDKRELDVPGNEYIRSSASEVERVRRVTSATNMNMTTHRDTSHVELVSDIATAVDIAGDDASENFVQGQNDATNDLGFDGPAAFDDVEDDKCGGHHPADEEVFDGADEDEPVMDLFRPHKYKHAPYRACKPSFVPEEVEKRRLKKREKLGLKTFSVLHDFLQRHVYHSFPKRLDIEDDFIRDIENDFSIIFGRRIRNLEKQRMSVIKKRALQHVGLSQRSDDIRSEENEIEADDIHSVDSEKEANEYEAVNKGSSDDEIENVPNTASDGNLTFADMPNDELEDRVRFSSMYMNFDDPNLLLKPAEQMTYQDLLKVHLQKYWSSAEETTSKLAMRVQQWEEKIQPLLEEEETRREFDIHQYGTELLDQYENIGETKAFTELVKNVNTRYDISRYYLASLMLANTGNIEIDSGCGIESAEDERDLSLKLLNKERYHQQFSES